MSAKSEQGLTFGQHAQIVRRTAEKAVARVAASASPLDSSLTVRQQATVFAIMGRKLVERSREIRLSTRDANGNKPSTGFEHVTQRALDTCPGPLGKVASAVEIWSGEKPITGHAVDPVARGITAVALAVELTLGASALVTAGALHTMRVGVEETICGSMNKSSG